VGLALSIPLADHIAEHLSVTEGEHGLYAEIVTADARLGFAVECLIREHDQFRCALKGRLTPDQMDEISRLLDRHCARGNDLMYEAFVVDLGGET
jgi:hypothetical protein